MRARGSRFLTTVVLTALALPMVQCSRPAIPPSPPRPRTVRMGRSVQGRPIEARVFEGTAGTVLIVGGIHGDEPVSTALVERLAQRLERDPAARAGRRVVLIARANPDGLHAGTRGNARGVDVNRNFPAANFRATRRNGARPLSEPESVALFGTLARFRPSCVVSVHGPLNCIDPDGGAASRQLARDMANLARLPLKDLPAHPGSLGSYCGHSLRVAMITYELDRKQAPSAGREDYLERHITALLLAIRRG